jgi:hypothetical protein
MVKFWFFIGEAIDGETFMLVLGGLHEMYTV